MAIQLQEDLTVIVIDFIDYCLECELQLPWLFITISSNGCMSYARYTANKEEDHLDYELLGEYTEGLKFILPINIIAIDVKGNAARGVISTEGVVFH